MELKSVELEIDLRRRIARGEFAPGRPLPKRSEMVRKHNIGMAAVQRALDGLKRDGFVHARRKAGTFVVDRPPHLDNYGLVVPNTAARSRFYTAIAAAARQTSASSSRRFHEYRTSIDTRDAMDGPRLFDAVTRHTLGALIFAVNPFELWGSPALTEPGVPRVSVQFAPQYDIPAVYPDLPSFLRRGMEYFASRGRRRVAHLYYTGPNVSPSQFEDDLRPHIQGFEMRSYWMQPIAIGVHTESAAKVVELMMQLDGDKRPDGLFIHDDNLVDHAIAGLLSAGTKLPQDLEVVAHHNFPLPIPAALPIKRLGFDCRTLMNRCLELIEMQRAGETPPPLSLIPAQFAEEIATAVTTIPEGHAV